MSTVTQSHLASPRAALRARGLQMTRAAFGLSPWYRAYRRRLAMTDVLVIVASVALAAWVHAGEAHVSAGPATRVATAAVLGLLWYVALAADRTYDPRTFGSGPLEFHRVFDASWKLFSLVAVVAFLIKMEGARTYLVVALPVGLVGLLATRYAWRGWLHRHRTERHMTTAVLAIGLRDQAERLIREMNGRPSSGYRVVGVCVPSGTVRAGEEIDGVPVLGDLKTAGAIAAQVGADCVAVSGSDAVTADVVRRLGWELEPVGVDLMLTAELADVAGPRITVTPAAGVSLLHVDAPRFAGPKFLLKAVMDWAGAAMLTVLVLPVLVVTAVAVKATSKGPVFFRQDRVGRGGRTFRMLKFRTMVVGAERMVAQVAADGDDGAGVLFKRRDDPRVTPVGRVLRRYSIDELPQLFNVLSGNMSLVGPRPPLPSEVSKYEARMRRRLLVKPGLTGLWQVGGRSDLPWEECVRLDVYYAENWTPFGDLMILARTAKAVFGGAGAY
ncbi:sugar transferase [Xylanimonas ulmi]|uniref:Undecaprenyl-phosphate galactose phosphotransferase WbaP/exopolysaccharide biosynthesis polyprenyl glycosylphosphotransferase n=1 Tax=Xylanimonas ulmi TaxID=228973 RepID=A0A4Q7M5Z5_9MICO|nr:sugar transferase [Xylanibacterium ulmi]RZS62072.1 Undecaprenyl-phosphate galactose phosphotransferase WbaP/exopolysaccharide biosynthesis polyprenyl glycosylphosphotransferase [Xylanibacterium ulmi]